MIRTAASILGLLIVAALPTLTAAQQVPDDPAAPPAAGQIGPTPLLTLDQERLFLESAIGRRVVAEIQADSASLAAENRQIEARLSAEEQDLTTRRPTMSATEFRQLADDFDSRVVAIRREQDEKLARLTARRDEERQRFYQAAAPVLGELVSEAGAVAILDNRAVFLSARRIDVTDEAIARIDRLLGDGLAPAPAPEPVPAPDPATPQPSP